MRYTQPGSNSNPIAFDKVSESNSRISENGASTHEASEQLSSKQLVSSSSSTSTESKPASLSKQSTKPQRLFRLRVTESWLQGVENRMSQERKAHRLQQQQQGPPTSGRDRSRHNQATAALRAEEQTYWTAVLKLLNDMSASYRQQQPSAPTHFAWQCDGITSTNPSPALHAPNAAAAITALVKIDLPRARRWIQRIRNDSTAQSTAAQLGVDVNLLALSFPPAQQHDIDSEMDSDFSNASSEVQSSAPSARSLPQQVPSHPQQLSHPSTSTPSLGGSSALDTENATSEFDLEAESEDAQDWDDNDAQVRVPRISGLSSSAEEDDSDHDIAPASIRSSSSSSGPRNAVQSPQSARQASSARSNRNAMTPSGRRSGKPVPALNTPAAISTAPSTLTSPTAAASGIATPSRRLLSPPQNRVSSPSPSRSSSSHSLHTATASSIHDEDAVQRRVRAEVSKALDGVAAQLKREMWKEGRERIEREVHYFKR
jgi:hypothetical protein